MQDKIKLKRFVNNNYQVVTENGLTIMDTRNLALPNIDIALDMVNATNSHQALVDALKLLLEAKRLKETAGKTAEYAELKQRAWAAAENALATAESAEEQK